MLLRNAIAIQRLSLHGRMDQSATIRAERIGGQGRICTHTAYAGRLQRLGLAHAQPVLLNQSAPLHVLGEAGILGAS